MGAGPSRILPKKPGSALLKATRLGDAQKVQEILDASPAAAGYCTLEGLTSLHVAAAARRADLLERLLGALRQAGSQRQPKAAKRSFSKSLNQKNVHGQTPLMLACNAGAADCVRLLLEAGADATLFDDLQQRTCLHYASLYGWAEAIEALLEDDSVVRGADGQQHPLRETLIPDSQGHHRYIDGRDGYGLAPLHLAASQGHLAAVKVLLKWGACLTVRCNVAFNLGATDPWTPCSTPLHFAAAGRSRVVQAILQAAAEQEREAVAQGRQFMDVRLMQDYRGQRPYDIAQAHGYRSLLWALSPRTPLAALIQRATQPPAVPSLASLAALALRRSLTQQLAALQDVAATEVRDQSSKVGGGSRRGSRAASREGSAHGSSGYAAFAAATAAGGPPRPAATAVLARLSGSWATSRQSPGHGMHNHSVHNSTATSCQPVATSRRLAAKHARRASDSGIASALQTFQPHSPHDAVPGGSLRAGRSFEEQRPFLVADMGLLCSADGAAGMAPFLSRACTASVASVAGCPVCLDSCLEVTMSPCGHGLCFQCASHLSRPDEGGCSPAARVVAPPLCPLCRGVMAAFQKLPA